MQSIQNVYGLTNHRIMNTAFFYRSFELLGSL